MPTVDFTKDELLADMRLLVKDEVSAQIDGLRSEVSGSFQELTDEMNDRFAEIDNRFVEIKVGLKGVRRVVRHSADIAELRAGA